MKEAVEAMGISEFITSEITFVAKTLVDVSDEVREKVEALVATLEDLDDVQDVYHNMSE